jgi:hypothetical protein
VSDFNLIIMHKVSKATDKRELTQTARRQLKFYNQDNTEVTTTLFETRVWLDK